MSDQISPAVESSAGPASCTPGPYRLAEGRSIVATWDTGEEVQIAAMNRSHWDTASSNGRNERLSRETKGNALLLAASWDLLAACKAVVSCAGDGSASFNTARKLARAAIAKVEGR